MYSDTLKLMSFIFVDIIVKISYVGGLLEKDMQSYRLSSYALQLNTTWASFVFHFLLFYQKMVIIEILYL